MIGESILFALFLIFTGGALLAALALHARQSMLVAYIVLGVAAGPHGFALINDPETIEQIGHVGIIFLLYLLGLNLLPSKLMTMLRQATLVTVTSSLAFTAIGFHVARAFGIGGVEALLAGAAMSFSSTIIGLKLLPTTALHHRHIGEIMIAILLLQDILAILILVALRGIGASSDSTLEALRVVVALPLLALVAWAFARYVLHRVIGRFDTIQEFIFLIAIGWCLGVAEAANALGLSREMGAFIAGVALATSPIANFIADSLKPLRDFFLVMFFFALGAAFDLQTAGVSRPAALGRRGGSAVEGDRRAARPGQRVRPADRRARGTGRRHLGTHRLPDHRRDHAHPGRLLLLDHAALPDPDRRRRETPARLNRHRPENSRVSGHVSSCEGPPKKRGRLARITMLRWKT